MYYFAEALEEQVDFADISYDLLQLARVSAEDVSDLVARMCESGRYSERDAEREI